MRRSFYHYLMTLKGPAKDSETDFANEAAKDIQFPKQTEDYHELSSYLEMNADYLSNMDIFDELWKSTLKTINNPEEKQTKLFLFFIHVIVNKSSDEFVRNEMKSMKNKTNCSFLSIYYFAPLCRIFSWRK